MLAIIYRIIGQSTFDSALAPSEGICDYSLYAFDLDSIILSIVLLFQLIELNSHIYYSKAKLVFLTKVYFSQMRVSPKVRTACVRKRVDINQLGIYE